MWRRPTNRRHRPKLGGENSQQRVPVWHLFSNMHLERCVHFLAMLLVSSALLLLGSWKVTWTICQLSKLESLNESSSLSFLLSERRSTDGCQEHNFVFRTWESLMDE